MLGERSRVIREKRQLQPGKLLLGNRKCPGVVIVEMSHLYIIQRLKKVNIITMNDIYESVPSISKTTASVLSRSTSLFEHQKTTPITGVARSYKSTFDLYGWG